MAHNLPPQGANYGGYSTLALWQKCIRWGVYGDYYRYTYAYVYSCKEVLHVEEPTPESEVQPSTIQSPENRKEDVGIMQCSCKDQEAPVINQEPMQSESSGAEEEQVGNKRKRRSTFEIPPSESLLRPTLSSVRYVHVHVPVYVICSSTCVHVRTCVLPPMHAHILQTIM